VKLDVREDVLEIGEEDRDDEVGILLVDREEPPVVTILLA